MMAEITIEQILDEAIRKAEELESPIDYEVRSILNGILALVYCNDTHSLEKVMRLVIEINLEKSNAEKEDSINYVV